MKYVLYAILIWLLYNFIFKLVIPIYLTSRKLKKGFKEMQEKMQEQFQQQQNAYQETAQPKTSSQTKPSKDDYLDFEEIKS